VGANAGYASSRHSRVAEHTRTTKFLNGNARLPTQFSHDKARDTIGRVALIRVAFNDNAAIHDGGVARVVFGRVIGMNRVRLINGKAKGRRHTLGMCDGSVRPQECSPHKRNGFGQYRRASPVRRHGSDFFVIKAHNHGHIGRIFNGMVAQCRHGAKDRGQIVQSRRIEEFAVHSTDRGGLRIVQAQVKIGNLIH
jgi:hypothetical protein